MPRLRPMTRRGFLAACAGSAVFPGLVPGRALALDVQVAPSNRITLASMGCGPQGLGDLRTFLGQPDVQVVAVCDVNGPRRAEAKRIVDGQYGHEDCAAYTDFREIMARPDIDAVLIATPDHWHVPMALAAARAGKNMYVEKPLGLSVAANQALRAAVQSSGVVFQFGTQHRSEWNFRFGCELACNGRIGRVHTIRVGSLPSLASPDFQAEPVPDWLDYERWLGPAPWAPFTPNRILNRYWWHTSDYSLGFVAGYGVHYVDIAHWGNGTEWTGPVQVEGWGEFPDHGLCDCATAWEVRCRYANGVTMVYTDTTRTPEGITFEGDEGSVYITLGRTETNPPALMKTTVGPDETRLYESNHHIRNFLDCIKTRARTICPIEVAVCSDNVCHLSDIAMRLKRPLIWDPATERFVNDAGADRLLTRAMRSPWRL